MHQQLYPRRRLGERRTVCPSRHGPESNRSRNAARQRIWRVFKGGLQNRILRFNPKRAACDWVSGHCHPTYLPTTNTQRKLANKAPLGPPLTVKRSHGSTNADPTFPRHCQFINFLVSQIGVLTNYFKKRWADAAGNKPLRTITARRTLEEPRLRTRFQAYMDYINTLAAQFPYGDEDPDPLILP